MEEVFPFSSDKIFHDSVTFAGIGTYRYEFDGTVLFMDEATKRILDLEPDFNPVGMNISDLVLDYNMPGSLRKATREKQQVRGHESRFTTLKRNIKWAIHDSYLVVAPETGKPAIQVVVREITREKLLEKALRESEQKYRLLFNEMMDAFIILEILRDKMGNPIDGRILEVNPALLKIWGTTESAVLGKTFLELFPKAAPDWVDLFQKVAALGIPIRTQKYSPIFDKYFEISCFRPDKYRVVVILREITEQVKAQESFQQELRFNQFASTISTKVAIADPSELIGIIREILREVGEFLFVSRIYILEFSQDRRTLYCSNGWFWQKDKEGINTEIEIRHDDLFDYWQRLTKNEIVAICSDILDEKKRFLFESLNKGTGLFLFMPLFVGTELIGLLGVELESKDHLQNEQIQRTLRFLAEIIAGALYRIKTYQILKGSEERFRSLVESLHEGLGIVNAEGRFEYVNARLAEILEGSIDSLVGRSFTDFICEVRVGNSPKEVLMALSDQSSSFESEVKSLSGRRRPVLITPHVFRNSNGEVTGGFSLVTDLTELKRLQAELVQSERMKALGSLAGEVAHDLNNILSGLVTLPDMLLTRAGGDITLRKSLELIKTAGEQAASIVEDLLILSRRGLHQSEVLDVNNVLQEYFQSPTFLRLHAKYAGVRFLIDIEPIANPIVMAKTLFLKCLTNLLISACNALAGEGEVTLRGFNLVFDKNMKQLDDIPPGSYFVLQVSDKGPIIPQEDIEHIFEPFYTRKISSRGGTGLGLTVVWNIMKDNSGYVHVSSIEGIGTTFTLYFPIISESVPVTNQLSSFLLPQGKGEKILVVDDIPEQREIARALLSSLGYEVVTVASGKEALEHIRNSIVDLVLLDMVLGDEMDGLDTCRAIFDIKPGQKVLLVTGFAESDRLHEALRLGAISYLKKPYTLFELGTVVSSAFEKDNLTSYNLCPPQQSN